MIDEYGAFNISLINDLPLFIDPFLLFHSKKPNYQKLHQDILKYMVFLRDATIDGRVNDDLERAWFMFPEVKQNWLGFSLHGNGGSGLGKDFAKALRKNLQQLFSDFGLEKVTKSSHIEKVCLVREGVGRDNISDFTTNLILNFLCRYTEEFARKYIDPTKRKTCWINKAWFDYQTESWQRAQFDLPMYRTDFVLLTPKDLLTRDENWINRTDMLRDFSSIPVALPDAELRGQVTNYFRKVLVRPRDREPNQREHDQAAAKTLLKFPFLLDYYIKIKEERGENAKDISAEKVKNTEHVFIEQIKALQKILLRQTDFYQAPSNTYDEAHQRLAFLKDVIENKGGHRIFYHKNQPVSRESDLQILYRLVWFGTPSDPSREVNDGRGPVDFKISRGAKDKTLVEMKLASNTQLERNLQRQLPIYQAASDAKRSIKVILFFTRAEQQKVVRILTKLNIVGNKDIVLIDGRKDNKLSGSKA